MYKNEKLGKALERFGTREGRLEFLIDVLAVVQPRSPEVHEAVRYIKEEFGCQRENGVERSDIKITPFDIAYKFVFDSLTDRGREDEAFEVLRVQLGPMSLVQRAILLRHFGENSIEVLRQFYGFGRKPEEVADNLRFAGFSDQEINRALTYMTQPTLYKNKPNKSERQHALILQHILREYEFMLKYAFTDGSKSGPFSNFSHKVAYGMNFVYEDPDHSRTAEILLKRYVSEKLLDDLELREEREGIEEQIASINIIAISHAGSNIIYSLEKQWERNKLPKVKTRSEIMIELLAKLRKERKSWE